MRVRTSTELMSLSQTELFDLAARLDAASALRDTASFSAIKGYVEDSGEGRWTVEEAIARAVPLPVITASLFERFSSRLTDNFEARMIAALRNEFGGHRVFGGAHLGFGRGNILPVRQRRYSSVKLSSRKQSPSSLADTSRTLESLRNCCDPTA